MKMRLWINCLQAQLFSFLEMNLGQLSQKEQDFVRIVELCDLEKYMDGYRWKGEGRRPVPRLNLAKAFIAKMVWNLPTTEALIEYLHASVTLRRLCGWECEYHIPDRSTFSRAFDQFATDELAQQVHQQLIQTHLGDRLIGHASTDGTEIEGRETPAPKPEAEPEVQPKPRGRPRKDEERQPPKPKRLDLQMLRTEQENMEELPKVCDVGCKRNSQGHQEAWIGYKMHIVSTDYDIPICACLTSASVHDSQVAIPLMQRAARLTPNILYDLMDAAYDAPQIFAYSRNLGHVPIIDPNPRCSKNPKVLAPHEKSRFKERSSVERVNSNLKDNWGGRFVRVRGAAKVACHLFFGLLAMTADRLISILP